MIDFPDLSAQSGPTRKTVFLLSGDMYCDTGSTVVTTVLGSCVAVCLLDRHGRGAGMNHFVLADNPLQERSARYGDIALEQLVAKMVVLGCRPGDLSAKLFGGAAVLPFGDAVEPVGTRNVRLAVDWLQRRGIPVVARRTGGSRGQMLRLYTATGQVLVRTLAASHNPDGVAAAPVQDWR